MYPVDENNVEFEGNSGEEQSLLTVECHSQLTCKLQNVSAASLVCCVLDTRSLLTITTIAPRVVYYDY